MKKRLSAAVLLMAATVLASCASGSTESTETTSKAAAATTTTTQKNTAVVPVSAKPADDSAAQTQTDTAIAADTQKYADLLTEINAYQETFFTVCEQYTSANSETSDKLLSDLFAELNAKFPQDNAVYQQYSHIKPDLEASNYGYDNAPDDYYVGAIAQYYALNNSYDKFLNDIYADLRKQLPADVFDQLKSAENQWVKDKEACMDTVAQNWGGVGSGNPEIDMCQADITEFRCLLLMLYFA
ncbi:MAG: DUF1311 domain-containing protein [Oscillospiraceae bacterium]